MKIWFQGFSSRQKFVETQRIGGLIYKEAKLSDVPRLLQIQADVYPGQQPWSYAHFVHDIKSKEAFFLMVGSVTEEAGFVGCRLRIRNLELHLTHFAVKKHYQNQGIGSELLVQTIRFARKVGARIVTLEVKKSNKAAQKLYENHGFEIIAEHFQYYEDGETALTMTKRLVGED